MQVWAINSRQQRNNATLIKKVMDLSDSYHKLSLLFYELSQSLEIQARNCTLKELKAQIGEVDFKKLADLQAITLQELKK